MPPKTFGGVAAGVFFGWLLMLCGTLASMVAEPPSHSFVGVGYLPNFRAADLQLRLFYLAVAGVYSAIIGGAVGGICGRGAYALSRRGMSDRVLRVGLAIAGAAAGFAAAFPLTVTVMTVVAALTAALLGAFIGVALANSVVRSAWATAAPLPPAPVPPGEPSP